MDTLSRDSNSKWIWIGPTMLILAGILAVSVLIWAACIGQQYNDTHAHDQYAIWQKLNHRTDLTYDEWLVAYRAGFLTVKP